MQWVASLRITAAFSSARTTNGDYIWALIGYPMFLPEKTSVIVQE